MQGQGSAGGKIREKGRKKRERERGHPDRGASRVRRKEEEN
jgi:hypothetical protein